MLSASSRAWPMGDDWVLQPKWDGFRLLIAIDARGRVRAWSRHGTSLTARLSELLAPFARVPAGSVFDGELVAIAERASRPVQDFAAVGRAIFGGAPAAAAQLQFVAFDLLELAGEDLRHQPWRHRDLQLREALPASERIRLVRSLPVSAATHDEIVGLGFEGSVLKRPRSLYRPGRNSAWVKHKARHTVAGELVAVRQDHKGQCYAICEVDGGRVVALASTEASEQVGEPVTLVYSRVDADGTLREVRLPPATGSEDRSSPRSAAGAHPSAPLS
jgi:ATP-dependent DNA ligase